MACMRARDCSRKQDGRLPDHCPEDSHVLIAFPDSVKPTLQKYAILCPSVLPVRLVIPFAGMIVSPQYPTRCH